jgi:hypothetical protein
MHWLAFVLSDLPQHEPAREASAEEAPRRPPQPPAAWRAVSALEPPSRLLRTLDPGIRSLA